MNQLRVRRRVVALVAAAAARRRSIQGSKNHLVVFLSSDRRQENLVDVNLTSKKSCYRLLLHTQLVTCSFYTLSILGKSLFFVILCAILLWSFFVRLSKKWTNFFVTTKLPNTAKFSIISTSVIKKISIITRKNHVWWTNIYTKLQDRHGEFEPGKVQYSIQKVFDRLFLIRNPKSRQRPNLACLACRGGPELKMLFENSTF